MHRLALAAYILIYVLALCELCDGKKVLILLGDDVGFESGVYGNKICKTPNIDQLATQSLVFDNGFTSVSSCSPSRSSLLTGLPHHQNGMFGLQNGYHHFQSFDTVKSLPNILGESGIYTGIIGKKHVAPLSVYNFNYSETEMDHHSTNQVGRNITYIKGLVQAFLTKAKDEDFLLYVAFHDAHRCGHENPEFGIFCENFGDSSIPGMGSIPDWKPSYYKPSEVVVPYFVPDTPEARRDIAAQYKTISRFDQGIGMVINELSNAGVLNDTLIIFSSDNGIPFPNGRTNLYEPGIREPFMVSHPTDKSMWGKRSSSPVTLLDIVPTVLDWFSIKYPKYSIFRHTPHVKLTGHSLLPLLQDSYTYEKSETEAIYTSQSLHEITMYYPMRSIRTTKYKLVENLAFQLPFPIDQDFYLSPTFHDILNRTVTHQALPWYKNLSQYYNRPRYELFNLMQDPHETDNLSEDEAYGHILEDLKASLVSWQNMTADPWLCYPNGVLEASGCMPLFNGL